MIDAQFMFVTEDARVMAKLPDGQVKDVTEMRDLLPQKMRKLSPAERMEKKRSELFKPAA